MPKLFKDEIILDLRSLIDYVTVEKALVNIQRKVSEGFLLPTDIIDVDTYDDYGAPRCEIRVLRKREYTKEEYEQHQKDLELQKKFERLQYEALKKKFES